MASARGVRGRKDLRLAPPERLLAVRLILWTAAARAWPADNWVRPLAAATAALAHDDLPVEIEAATGSLAAVAVAILRSAAPRSASGLLVKLADATAERVAYLLPGAEQQYVHEYARLLDSTFGAWANADLIMDIADAVVRSDPVSDAVAALVEELG